MDQHMIGIITFHASHNCGSMMQAYALQTYLERTGHKCEIIDFSNEGQRELYSLYPPMNSIKNIIKRMVFLKHSKRLKNNYACYNRFMEKQFFLSEKKYFTMDELSDGNYYAVITGSDQVWNTTIADSDDAYFLSWVNNAKKIAYAPSFGAKNIQENVDDPQKYSNYLKTFDALSIREFNGQKWIRELIGKNVPVLIDPTLLLSADDYNRIASVDLDLPEKYIFFYAPNFHPDFVKLVKQISDKCELPVITYNAKTYYVKGVKKYGFTLPDYESPDAYLQLIKKATLVITTSFHGTIFSTIYRKPFWVIKNGGMFGDDDRVLSLVRQLSIENRFITTVYDENKNYLESVDYCEYEKRLLHLQKEAAEFIRNALVL